MAVVAADGWKIEDKRRVVEEEDETEAGVGFEGDTDATRPMRCSVVMPPRTPIARLREVG